VRGGKQRELLALLVVHANDVVSSDGLIEGLWRDQPPPSALKTLQVLLSRLRSDLGSASGALETHGYGYLLRVDPERFDADAFRAGVEGGRRALARGEAEEAATALRAALALWRGQALAEFRYHEFAQSEIARLEELRLAAQEERIAADLARINELRKAVAYGGREPVTEIYAWIAANSLRASTGSGRAGCSFLLTLRCDLDPAGRTQELPLTSASPLG